VTQCVATHTRTALANKHPNGPLVPRPSNGLADKQPNHASLPAVVKTAIVKTETKPTKRTIRRPFDGSGLLSAAARLKHAHWREARRAKTEQAKQAAFLKLQAKPSSSVEDLEDLGLQVIAGLRVLEQREREVSRRMYNRASAKLSSQRRTSYLSVLKAEDMALQASLGLRLEQVETLNSVICMAKQQGRPACVKTEPMVKTELMETERLIPASVKTELAM
jgi:hypothetical protein